MTMDLQEVINRQDELDRIVAWLTDHDPREYLQYYRVRGIELDAQRPGPDMPVSE